MPPVGALLRWRSLIPELWTRETLSGCKLNVAPLRQNVMWAEVNSSNFYEQQIKWWQNSFFKCLLLILGSIELRTSHFRHYCLCPTLVTRIPEVGLSGRWFTTVHDNFNSANAGRQDIKRGGGVLLSCSNATSESSRVALINTGINFTTGKIIYSASIINYDRL